MQAVDLNLASRPFKNDTLPWVGFVAGVLLLIFTSWYNVDVWHRTRSLLFDLEQRQVNVDGRLSELERRRAEAERRIDKMKVPVLVTRSNKANEVIRWKSFSWTRLFNMLQEVQPADVQLSSIHPVFRGDNLRVRDTVEDLEQVPVSVEGIAKDLRSFLEFERQLIFSPHFDRIDPGTLATDDVTGESIFRMRFLYDPRVIEEPPEPEEQLVAAEQESAAEEGSPETTEDTITDAGEAAAEPEPEAAVETLPGVAAPALDEPSQLASEELPKIKRRRNRKPQTEAAENAADSLPQTQAPLESAAREPLDPTEQLPLREPRPDWGTAAAPLVGVADADEEEE